MKMHKKHKLAVAICLACGVGSAQAAISNGGLAAHAGGANAPGELFLSVWDQLAQTSYSLDLGTLVTDLISSQNTSHVWNLDQTFTNWAALTTDTLTFNVAGNNSWVGKTSPADSVIISTRTGGGQTALPNFTGFQTIQNNVEAHVNSINVAAGEAGGTNFAANNSEVTTNILDAAYFNNTFWGVGEGIANFIGSATVRNGGADQTLNLFDFHAPAAGFKSNAQNAVVDTLNGTVALNIAAGTLTYTANVTAVPLPGAVWLFLGGLLTTLRLQKRRVSGLAA